MNEANETKRICRPPDRCSYDMTLRNGLVLPASDANLAGQQSFNLGQEPQSLG